MRLTLVGLIPSLAFIVSGCSTPNVVEPPPAPVPTTAPTAPPNIPSGPTFVYLFSRDGRSDRVQAFRVNPETGLLEGAGGHSRGAPGRYGTITADYRGRFLYMITWRDGFADTLHAVRIDPATGALSAGRAASVPRDVTGVAVHPSGRVAYLLLDTEDGAFAPCRGRGRVYAHDVNPETGALDPGALQTIATVNVPRAMVFHPSGRFAYVAGRGDSTQLYGPCPVGAAAAYAVDPDSGRLTEAPGSPFAVAHTNEALALTPSGETLYVRQGEQPHDEARSSQWPSIVAYHLDSGTGTPALLETRELERRWGVFFRLDPRARFIYVGAMASDESTELHVLRVQPSGRLQPAPGSPVPTGPHLGLVRASLAFEPSGRFAYQISAEGYAPPRGIDVFAVDPSTGALTAVAGSPQTIPDVGELLMVTVR